MGMFDYFHSSYDLGETFTNVICQTKDIEEGYGGTMTDYWLDPAGRLWRPDYRDTHTFEEINRAKNSNACYPIFSPKSPYSQTFI